MHHPCFFSIRSRTVRLLAASGVLVAVSGLLTVPQRSAGQDPQFPPSASSGTDSSGVNVPGDPSAPNPSVGIDTAGHADVTATRNGRTTRQRLPAAPVNPLVLTDPARNPDVPGDYSPDNSQSNSQTYPQNYPQTYPPSNSQDNDQRNLPNNSAENSRGYLPAPPAPGNHLIPPVVTRQPGDYTVVTDPSSLGPRRYAKPLPLFGYDFFQPARQIIVARRRALLPVVPRFNRYNGYNSGYNNGNRTRQGLPSNLNGLRPNNGYPAGSGNNSGYNYYNGYGNNNNGYGNSDGLNYGSDGALLGAGAALGAAGQMQGGYGQGGYGQPGGYGPGNNGFDPNGFDPNQPGGLNQPDSQYPGNYSNSDGSSNPNNYPNSNNSFNPNGSGSNSNNYSSSGGYPDNSGSNAGNFDPNNNFSSDPNNTLNNDPLNGDVTSNTVLRRRPMNSNGGFNSQDPYSQDQYSQNPNYPNQNGSGYNQNGDGFPGDAGTSLGSDIQFPGDDALVQNGTANAVTGQIADPISTLYKNVLASLPPNYQLQPGDALTVRYSALALAPREFTTTVDLQGGINIEGVGRVSVAGRTASQAEDTLRQRLARLYRNVDVSINLRQLRTIQVTVSGAAFAPGTYTVPATATAFNVLNAAGGPTATGSLRDIRVLRNGRLVGSLDIYPLIGANSASPGAKKRRHCASSRGQHLYSGPSVPDCHSRRSPPAGDL